METRRALLLIADIGGYTEYMRTHRMSLAHAEVNTARLLEAIERKNQHYERAVRADMRLVPGAVDFVEAAALLTVALAVPRLSAPGWVIGGTVVLWSALDAARVARRHRDRDA